MMGDQLAADILRHMLTYGNARGNGKSGIIILHQEAIGKAIIALERRTRAKNAERVGRLFKRWLCPACFYRVNPDENFCPRCGQAYKMPPRKKVRILICDELERAER